jgi:hypothetical protein
MLMRSRRALGIRAACQRDLKLKLIMLLSSVLCWSDIVVAQSSVVCFAQPAEQDNDDSDGGVKLIARKAKTYVGLDIVYIDGKMAEDVCEAIQIIVPRLMGAMSCRMKESERCRRRKEFAVTKKSLGGFDGWRMEGLASPAQARPTSE